MYFLTCLYKHFIDIICLCLKIYKCLIRAIVFLVIKWSSYLVIILNRKKKHISWILITFKVSKSPTTRTKRLQMKKKSHIAWCTIWWRRIAIWWRRRWRRNAWSPMFMFGRSGILIYKLVGQLLAYIRFSWIYLENNVPIPYTCSQRDWKLLTNEEYL